MNKIRVGAVSYLNTKPLLYGLQGSELARDIEVLEAYPSQVAQMLLDDRIDVGLVPVAVIPNLTESHIITGYCIGAEGEVASVAIFSEVPMEEIDTVLLDYQSRTSVALAQVLLKEYWKKEVRTEHASEDFRNRIKGRIAGVVIGDRALEQRRISPFIYDLGAAWKAHTGLPFVFAAWVANKVLPVEFEQAFDAVNAYGLSRIPEVVAQYPYLAYDLATYYTKNISYRLTEEKRKGLQLFLGKLESWV